MSNKIPTVKCDVTVVRLSDYFEGVDFSTEEAQIALRRCYTKKFKALLMSAIKETEGGDYSGKNAMNAFKRLHRISGKSLPLDPKPFKEQWPELHEFIRGFVKHGMKENPYGKIVYSSYSRFLLDE